jgi:cytochrome b561
MSASSKKSQYTTAKVLHWAAAIIIIFNLLAGWRMDSFSPDIKRILLMIHSGVGTLIFLVMLFRWWWRRKNNLYNPPNFWRRPAIVLQWIFYPLVLLQVLIGLSLASVIDSQVLAFGLIPYSDLAADDERLRDLFLQVHGTSALVLILLVVTHAIERLRLLYTMDDAPAPSGQ